MERERINRESVSRTIQQKNNFCGAYMVDNRSDKNQNYLSDSPLQRICDEEEELLQGKFDTLVQRVEDEEDTLQGKFDSPIQKKNETGMPDNLKSGIESLSGFSMDDVRVHYNSSKPATVQALAYTQGTDIHVAPGQEKCLPHEAWHVAQQMAGRVSPTTNINGMPVNDNAALEHEADVMGEKAVSQRKETCALKKENNGFVAQRMGFREILNAFGVNMLSIKEIEKVAEQNENFKRWYEDAVNASQYVEEVKNEGDFKSVKENDSEKILGDPNAHYPGKEDTDLSDEMKIITILHELMHTSVRNGSYVRGDFQGKTLGSIQWNNDIQKSHFSNSFGVNVHDCPINVDSVDDIYEQSHNACLNVDRLIRCLKDDNDNKKIDNGAYEYIFARIRHMTILPEYDAVLGDLVYYMMRKRLTQTRTYEYANILLEDANKRRHDSKKLLHKLDENGMYLESLSASEGIPGNFTDAATATSVLDSSSQGESLQRKADMANNAAQRAEAPRPNNTGMPDNLKAGIESLSGFSMDDVRVHYNSSKPATVQALAYTQGTDIHVAPGQEKCLPHEAWHVAQQMAGRVSPTTNINGMPVNDDAALEHEADVMGEKAVQCKNKCKNISDSQKITNKTVQCVSVVYKNKENFCIEKKFDELYDLLFFAEAEYVWIGMDKVSIRAINDFYSKIMNKSDNYVRFMYLDISKCITLEDVLDAIMFAAANATVEMGEKYSLQPLGGCMVFDSDALENVKKKAFKECHGGRTFDSVSTQKNQKSQDEISRYNVFFEKYTSGTLNEMSVNRTFVDQDDLIHQIAQDYLLYSAIIPKNPKNYQGLIGIRHQYDEYNYSDGSDRILKITRSSGSPDVPNEVVEKKVAAYRIYRSMPLMSFVNCILHGHGGALGMALKYDSSSYGQVLVEFSFNEAIPCDVVGEGNEGSAPSSQALGRKSESKSCLPQFLHVNSLNEGELDENAVNTGITRIFSFNFGGSRNATSSETDSFMEKRNPRIRVVFDNYLEPFFEKDKELQKVYEYMKRNVTSYKSWKKIAFGDRLLEINPIKETCEKDESLISEGSSRYVQNNCLIQAIIGDEVYHNNIPRVVRLRQWFEGLGYAAAGAPLTDDVNIIQDIVTMFNVTSNIIIQNQDESFHAFMIQNGIVTDVSHEIGVLANLPCIYIKHISGSVGHFERRGLRAKAKKTEKKAPT